jgi:hypothetical protein
MNEMVQEKRANREHKSSVFTEPQPQRLQRVHSREAAIVAAIKACLSRNIFVSFLEKHGAEVVNMLLEEYDHNVALEVAKEEGIEEGIGIGVEKGIGIGVKKERAEFIALLDSGMSLVEIKQKLRSGESI